jgi:hypothetical protein
MKKLTKWEKENQDFMWRSLYGVSPDLKYGGHYKGVPVFTHPDVPKGMIYFLNDKTMFPKLTKSKLKSNI